MEKLRVDSGIKQIEVNDDGDRINIPISDAAFYQRFADILKYFDEKQTEIDRQAKEYEKKHHREEGEKASTDEIVDTVSLYAKLCKDTCAKLDELFGEGCCQKVFVGVQIPGVELIGQFFEQITPILQKFADERNEKIKLIYNNNRKGARSK